MCDFEEMMENEKFRIYERMSKLIMHEPLKNVLKLVLVIIVLIF